MKDTDAIMNALFAAAILGSKKKEAQTEVDNEKARKQAENVGNSFYAVYLGFKDAGFTDDQAFELLLNTIGRQ